jgi:phosphoribosylglycinamide formyltransferase 2
VQKSGDYVESWQPQAMTANALKSAQNIAKTITDALGGFGLFGVELFIKGDQVWCSEVSPRPHDTGMVTMCSQKLSEFELHARAILGLPVDVSMTNIGASAVIYGGIESKNLKYDGLEAALAVPCSDVRLFGKPESFVRRRMGVALATGKDTDEARSRAKLAASLVKTSN